MSPSTCWPFTDLKARYAYFSQTISTTALQIAARQPRAQLGSQPQLCRRHASRARTRFWEGGRDFGRRLVGRAALFAFLRGVRTLALCHAHFYVSPIIEVDGDCARGWWRLWQKWLYRARRRRRSVPRRGNDRMSIDEERAWLVAQRRALRANALRSRRVARRLADAEHPVMNAQVFPISESMARVVSNDAVNAEYFHSDSGSLGSVCRLRPRDSVLSFAVPGSVRRSRCLLRRARERLPEWIACADMSNSSTRSKGAGTRAAWRRCKAGTL